MSPRLDADTARMIKDVTEVDLETIQREITDEYDETEDSNINQEDQEIQG